MTASATHARSSDDPTFPELDALRPDLEALYKDIHEHPELSMRETRTAGIAAQRLRDARAAGTINEIPSNHNPRFAPVIHPTLRTGVEALVVAARAWLSVREQAASCRGAATTDVR